MNEVKGIWFESARTHVRDRYGQGMLDELVQAVAPEYRSAITDPLAGAWYPEEALQQLLAAMSSIMAGDDPREFVRIIEESTEHAVGRFFRLLLQIGRPAFALRNVPTLWERVRRGPGRVEVELARGVAAIAYRDFPYFGDPHYRLMTIGTLSAVARLAGARSVDAAVLRHGEDWLDVEVRYG